MPATSGQGIAALRELIEVKLDSLEQQMTREFASIKEALANTASKEAVQRAHSRIDELERELRDKETEFDELLFQMRIIKWAGGILNSTLAAVIIAAVMYFLKLN